MKDAADRGGPIVSLTGNVEIAATSWDEDDLFEELMAEIEVDVHQEGEHILEAKLYQKGELVADRPFWRAPVTSGKVIAGQPGNYRVRFAFSGEQIYRSAKNGPYQLQVQIAGQPDGDQLRVETADFDHRAFGELTGRLVEIRIEPSESTGGGHSDQIFATVSVEARKSGMFGVEARLSLDGVTIDYDGKRKNLFKGRHSIELEFSGDLITRQGLDEQFVVTVILYDAELRSIDDLMQATAPTFEPGGPPFASEEK